MRCSTRTQLDRGSTISPKHSQRVLRDHAQAEALAAYALQAGLHPFIQRGMPLYRQGASIGHRASSASSPQHRERAHEGPGHKPSRSAPRRRTAHPQAASGLLQPLCCLCRSLAGPGPRTARSPASGTWAGAVVSVVANLMMWSKQCLKMHQEMRPWSQIFHQERAHSSAHSLAA